MMKIPPLFRSFSRIEIIHMKERVDRFRLLTKELHSIGITVDHDFVRIPDAPVTEGSNGFASRQVHGNFLSHLDILRRAGKDQLDSVLILEDDAIFSSRLHSENFQEALATQIEKLDWDILYIGHPEIKQDNRPPFGLNYVEQTFKWAHCYAVSNQVLHRLIQYLESSMSRPSGHPLGGKMYIDGAINHFRSLNPDVKVIAHYPTLSIQRGSPSGIAQRKWYDKIKFFEKFLAFIRDARDRLWKKTDIYIGEM